MHVPPDVMGVHELTRVYGKCMRVGRRRVAWLESDIAAWQAGLEVGTRL
jgi:Prophage CP4-57 regulatory protein (AlpA)